MKNPERRQASSGFEQLSFLLKPDFNPVWPTPNTLPARCLSLLLAGHALTHQDFIDITGSWRLAAVIFTLKGLDWPIESYEIPAPTIEAPSRHICRYYLSGETIKQAFGGAK
ncbi:MAG TPA: hypothetical protein VJ654_13235 [Noviherbaspirillum sp.]|nr:hypothetical protein [Noviherbaspirillum sp.]